MLKNVVLTEKNFCYVGRGLPLFENTIKENLKDQPDQRYRICALDKTYGRKKIFNISNNSQGISSSFYKFGKDANTLWQTLIYIM